jgi:hypothetical protein
MNKIVVYTAIFGPYDGLIPQTKISGIDFICFTDQEFKSNSWKIIKCAGKYSDDNRNAKEYKILPHRYLEGYDISIWIDGNFIIWSHPEELLKLLNQSPFVLFNHYRNCIYDEHTAILQSADKDGAYRDDPKVMQAQIDRYRGEGFPSKFGLSANSVLIRMHHHPSVIQLMEMWWEEIQNGSKRDQLSLYYLLWKTGFKPMVLQNDLNSCQWFFRLGSHRKNFSWKYFRFRLNKYLDR